MYIIDILCLLLKRTKTYSSVSPLVVTNSFFGGLKFICKQQHANFFTLLLAWNQASFKTRVKYVGTKTANNINLTYLENRGVKNSLP